MVDEGSDYVVTESLESVVGDYGKDKINVDRADEGCMWVKHGMGDRDE